MTKFCKGCGKIMWDVSPQRRLCDSCREKAPEERGKPAKKKAPKKRIKPMTIAEVVREAEKRGMSYGKFVFLGLDKIEVVQ